MFSNDQKGDKQMLKGSSRFKGILGLLVIIFSSFTLMGCPKKVSPVVGSEGLASESAASSGSQSKAGSGQNGSASGEGSSAPGMKSDGRSEDMAASKGSGSGGHSSSGDHGSAGSGDDVASLDGSHRSKGFLQGENSPKFSSDVFFDFDKWLIRSDSKQALTENARWLVTNSRVKIQIEGHGDERGTSDYNLALGERRARSTKRYLTNLGVDPSRISFISFGEEKNVCSEKSEHCFQKNRRAHFIVKK